MRFGATLWDYFVEFHACREDPDCLVLCYEDLVRDLPSQLPLIARHMGFDCPAEVAAEVSRVASKDFMRAHESKFDGSWAYERMRELGRLPEEKLCCNRPATRVTDRSPCQRATGNGGSSMELAALDLEPEAAAFLRSMWDERVAAATGCASYELMVADIRSELERRRAALV